jgi:hypothetical protein
LRSRPYSVTAPAIASSRHRFSVRNSSVLIFASDSTAIVRFGPTLAAEHLAREDGVAVHHDTLRRWMLAAGLWSRARKRAPHRQRRARQAHFGELVQLDGSFHLWYEDRASRGCLMNLVDDATGRTLARLGAQETIWAAVDVLRRWIEAYGVPLALYTDWKNVYVRAPNAEEQVTGAAPLTQFGRRRWGFRSSPRARRKPRAGSSAITGRIRIVS